MLRREAEEELGKVLRSVRRVSSSPWIRNSFLYGLSHSSQVVIYLLVVAWSRIGSETDSFFLAYAVAVFVLSAVSATTSQVMIPYLRQETGLATLFLAAGTGLLLLGGSLITHSNLLLAMVPAAAFGVGSSLLSGRLNFRRIFWKPPVASLLGAVSTFLVAFPLHGLFGLLGIGLALSVGEGVRFLLLSSNSLLAWTPFPVGNFFRLFGVTALLGVTPVAVRFILSFGGPPGGVTIFSYAWGLMGVLLSFTTVGLVVTEGGLWRNFSQASLVEAYQRLLPYIVGLSALLLVGTLAGGLLILVLVPAPSQFLLPVFLTLLVFVSGLSLYILASAALPPMIILGRFLPLARAALWCNFIAVGGSWLVAGSPASVVGSASAMVIGTGLLATLMVRSFLR